MQLVNEAKRVLDPFLINLIATFPTLLYEVHKYVKKSLVFALFEMQYYIEN